MASRARALALVTAALLIASCARRREEAPCNAVAAHVLVLAQAETRDAKVDEALRQRVAMQLPALRDAIEESCSAGGWATAVRACMLAAADGATLASCQLQLTAEQRASLAKASTAP